MYEDLPDLKAYKRTPSVENSTWYKGILTTSFATDVETGGDYDLVLGHIRKGSELPPHVHTHENELFYVLEGEIAAHAGAEVFHVRAGESMFLPMGKPHAFLIQSPEVRLLSLITPGGIMKAITRMAEPARKLEPPPADALNYATADMEPTLKIFEEHGVRFLTEEEIAQEMPSFPR